ncbi:MAG: glycoside hydrolase family 9 protein [Lachnospiraceae bacterium]|nr:glycoside hydrolase family 9 protein [Lachnospiraceae bacterium]
MNSIYVDQTGYLPGNRKRAAMNFSADSFEIRDEEDRPVYEGRVTHFGTDDISGEDIYTAAFDDFDREGTYRVYAGGVSSVPFKISDNVYDGLLKDLCKCLYYLRCGNALDEGHAGVFYHKPCHMLKARIYGGDGEVDVCGGWHDAGDYGRYSTAGAVALGHILYAVRFYEGLKDVKFDIPEVAGDKGDLPDILAEAKVELDFLMKMQREDGSVWHKVTTFCHAPFIMPEDDKGELFLFPVSSMATADIAAVMALAYTVYKDHDASYAARLMDASLKAYGWLKVNPEPVLFKNAEGSDTGEYGEREDISNRFWAACALYEAVGEKAYLEDALKMAAILKEHGPEFMGRGDVFTGLGWAGVAGFGSMSLMLRNDDDPLCREVKERFIKEADRLRIAAGKNGFGLCMEKADYIWGSNMELLKYMMILTLAGSLTGDAGYKDVILAGMDYLLGCNTMDTGYVTGAGAKSYRHPHLRPTVAGRLSEPWPGLVSGGPNMYLQDDKAKEIKKGTPPMKCYIDHEEAYSVNEITIYWNSPFIFVLAALVCDKK